MGSSDLFLLLLIGAILLGAPLTAVVLSLIAYARTKKLSELTQRITLLESQARWLHSMISAQPLTPPVVATPRIVASPDTDAVATPSTNAERIREPVVTESTATSEFVERPTDHVHESDHVNVSQRNSTDPVGWESFIGQKAFGWLAVLLFVLSASFFLKYAFQNNWVGPIGRVAIGELVGAALVWGGWRYFRSGLVRFSSMLTSAGIIVLYLATYSAFGFYRLLPQTHAGFFLAVLILESMAAAVLYRSAVIALVAVIGGLLTPVLLASDHDTYQTFFCYLLMLNLGVVVALILRSWSVVGSVAYLGTQLLFWLWYDGNYHPEKLAWAIGFQTVLFAFYVTQSLVGAIRRKPSFGWEELGRVAATPVIFFLAFRVLGRDDYGPWLGTAAVGMSTLYAVLARVVLDSRRSDQRILLTLLSVAVGFAAWSIPVQAEARWVSLGWAAMSTALWWFGLRVSAIPLRAMAGILAAAAVGRVLMFDLPLYTRDPFIPVLNRFALPSLGVAACLLRSVVLADGFLSRLRQAERFLIGVAGVAGIMLLWLVLSFDCHGYFVSRAVYDNDVFLWRWRGQLALTVFWTAFATGLLVLGFSLQRARMRWLAMILFGVTVTKLFVVDMANVQQLYRILAFFVLAVVLGLVARAYQRFR